MWDITLSRSDSKWSYFEIGSGWVAHIVNCSKDGRKLCLLAGFESGPLNLAVKPSTRGARLSADIVSEGRPR